MKKKLYSIIAIILAILMVGSVLFSIIPTLVYADNSGTIKKRINNLESEAGSLATRKNKLEKEISAKKSQSQTTINQKSQIDQQMEITRLEIQNTNDQIQEYNLLLAEKQAELDEGLQHQASLNLLYKSRIRAMEENGTVSYWSILFKANSFSDLLDRLDMIVEISTSDQLMLQEIQKNNDAIKVTRAEIESDRTKLEEKVAELDALNETLEKQKQEAESLILKLAKELESLNGSYEELDAQESAIRAQILEEEKKYQAALTEEQKARLAKDNANNAAGGGSGGFICPVPRGSSTVTDAFGYRIHPIYKYYGMHSGVDLAAALGTPVYAIASGNVNVSAYASANGNYVSISHGGGYGSLYAHLDYATVSAGTYVTQGQIIGYVGSTGWATGPHLHFEIHLNGSPVNPMNYIST